MINSPIYIFDSIGCKFSILNNDFLIGQSLPGYNALSQSHVGSHIPYLVRSGKDWEVGVGYVKNVLDKVVVQRLKVVKSSNNDSKVKFLSSDSNQFYIFANEAGFNSGFNNVLVRDSDFAVDKVKAVYLIDSSYGPINCSLPPVSETKDLVIEFKVVGGDNPVYIRNANGNVFTILADSDSYLRLASDGSRWVGLNSNTEVKLQALSDDNPSFSVLSDPSGALLSFQYNVDGTKFNGGEIYYGSGNKILFGDDAEATAHHIIPTTGNSNVIFNNDNTNTNFIVEGSGTRNLFFDYRGRLGLNIPSGSSPDTILHIINTTCKEGIRLENRSACHPANVTLYYKPSSPITTGTVISEINLAAKNSLGNQINYAQIEAIALDTTATTTKGQISINVATTDAAGSGVTTLVSNPDYTTVGYSNNNLTVTNNGSSKIGYSGSYLSATSSAVTLQAPTLNFNSTNIVLGTGAATNVNVPSLYASYIQSNTLKIQNIAENSILTINSSGNVAAGQSVRLPIPENYILTTTTNGAITGIYSVNDYFRTDSDIAWNQYEARPCNVAIRQILFTSAVPSVEYVVGDQVEIVIGTNKYYRTVESIDTANNEITALLLNQNVTSSSIASGNIQSITRGGYLFIGKDVETGTISDATTNIISVRPRTDTEFNTNQKDINFKIYGMDDIPALSVKANAGRKTLPSGLYHPFASHVSQCVDCIQYSAPNNDDVELFPMIVNSGGSGLSNAHSSANFDYIASGLFSGIVSTVGTNGLPSYYGTYDQNGNAAEWIEDANASSTSASQFVAGGSWKTEIVTEIGASGLKSIESLVRSSGYDYVGFRIASQYNLTDVTNISTTLGMEFVSVSNPDNIPDDGILYLYDNNEYSPIEFPNLGVVGKNYRIGKFEITNSQYIRFLNAVATTNDRNLFKSQMTSSAVGGITRVGDGSSSPYEYSVKPNMGNKPVVFVDYLSVIRFINWLHNGAQLSGITDIDTTIDFGAYDIFPIGASSYLINKNIYQKYWLPGLHEWHKAAYFESREGIITDGSSAVMVKRQEPYIVTDKTDIPILANLSVSGWLYVDHLIVGDNKNVSSIVPRRTLPSEGGTGGGTGGGGGAFDCTSNTDCEECEVCSPTTNTCVPSTDTCCVQGCCKPGTYNFTTGTCGFCEGCAGDDNPIGGGGGGAGAGDGGGGSYPCEAIGCPGDTE